MAKVVIDANIIVSSVFGGIPFEATVKTIASHKVYISVEIEAELRGVIARLSNKLTEEYLTILLKKIDELIKMATLVSVSKRIVLSRDAKDDHYLSLCKEINADFLITGDKDLLDISRTALKQKGIKTRILTPREFLEEVE